MKSGSAARSPRPLDRVRRPGIAPNQATVTGGIGIASSQLARGCGRNEKLAPSSRPAGHRLPSALSRNQPFALRLLAGGLACAADRFALLPRRLFRWLLVKSSTLHLTEDAIPLHLLFEDPQSLIDVVVADEYLQETFPSCVITAASAGAMMHPRSSRFRTDRKNVWRQPASSALAARAQVQGLRGLDTASSHLARVAGE
jgi:hypothetical protein